MAVPTKLFNIRLPEHKLAAYKKYAEKQNMSMSKILIDYIDALLAEELIPLAKQSDEEHLKTAKWEDPLAVVRDQYQEGRDF